MIVSRSFPSLMFYLYMWFSLKAYAVTALMKVYAFEKMSGRKVDILPEVNLKSLFAVFLYFVLKWMV